jgi:L-ascorbate metabolism protein UlaG (beta-lactamase superfamily)
MAHRHATAILRDACGVPATLDWYGCATFRLTIDDLVVFLDAYIDRAPGAPGTGLTADDVDRADWILVGHSHFDHLWGAERIARNTGATIVGSYESIRVMAEQGVPMDQLLPVAGGEPVRLSDDVMVNVYPSQHSCVWTKSGGMFEADSVCLGDLGVTHQERLARFGDMRGLMAGSLSAGAVEHLMVSQQDARGDGGALVFMIDTPEGSLLYQDTSGHWTGILHDLRPDVAILAAAGRGNVDGEPVQGSLAGFVARQASLVRAPTVILSHHDDWLPGFSKEIDVKMVREAMALQAPRTELVELDYLDGHAVFERAHTRGGR